MRLTKNDGQAYFIILIISIFYFVGLGHVHLFDWDEINFAECAREMIRSGNYLQMQINFEPFYEKPPLFIWMQVLSMKFFGINEFAARFPNALFGFITLITLYRIGKRHYDEQFGIIWSLLFFGAFLPHMYFKSGIIDPVFNYFIFLSIYYLIRTIYENKKRGRYALFSGILIGLAILTKGPVGFLIFILVFIIFQIINGFRKFPKLKHILIFTFTVLITISFWFGTEILVNGVEFIKQFIIYQVELFTKPVAGHQQPFYYHFVVVFLGCFPISIFAFGIINRKNNNHSMDFHKWMIILFITVMILFTIVKTKIIHYSSMSYLPLSFMAALYFNKLKNGYDKVKKGLNVLFLFIGLIFGAFLIAIPVLGKNKDKIFEYLSEDFAIASLQQDVNWTGFEIIAGIIFIFAVCLGFIMLRRNRYLSSIVTVSIGIALSMLLFLFMVLPKIESHSQRAAIDFYKSIKDRDVYVTTVNFKSYAHYFYTELPADNRYESKDKDWLINGNIDKPVYFVTKINSTYLDQFNDIKKLKETGGFKFYYRKD